MQEQLITAVAFIVYNRPDKTQKVFDSIRQAKPSKLFIIADGPKDEKVGDSEKCLIVRQLLENVDWECEVYRNYSEVNIGCKLRVSSGISWVFEHVEEAIILEDDCLPNPTFYRFCQELLEVHRNNSKVMMISGNNFQDGKIRGEYSYYFSRFSHIWGWATWKRAWYTYDAELETFPVFKKENKIKAIFNKPDMQKYWLKFLENNYSTPIDTWDYQWVYTIWKENGFVVLPNSNLVTNIGFDAEALHTKNSNSKLAKIQVNRISFPLKHPSLITDNKQADYYTFKRIFSTSFLSTLKHKIQLLLKGKKTLGSSSL